MKFSIVLIFALLTPFLLAHGKEESSESDHQSYGYSDESGSEEEVGTPVSRGTLADFSRLEITPGSNFPARERGHFQGQELRPIARFFERAALGDRTQVLYMITTQGGDLNQLPIWDLGNRMLELSEIQTLLTIITDALRQQAFFRYIGITTRGVHRRSAEHGNAVANHPERRLALAVLNENAQGAQARMHVLLRGVHPDQIHRLEAELIRALDATGPLGLNANTGHLGRPEQGVRGQVELTPNTDTPHQGNRRVLQFRNDRLVPAGQNTLPATWQDIVYMITPPDLAFRLPIIDLQGEFLTPEEIQMLEFEMESGINELRNAERYVGMASAGQNGDRTPQTRSREHELASVHSPFRRLPLAITRMNRAVGPAQMHVLVAGIHPEQIAEIETRLIRIAGGTTLVGLNSNPGRRKKKAVAADTGTYARNSKRDRDEDPDGDYSGFRVPLFLGPSGSRASGAF